MNASHVDRRADDSPNRSGGEPIVLVGGHVWAVDAGAVDLFYVSRTDSTTPPWRRPMFRASAGQLVFAPEAGDLDTAATGVFEMVETYGTRVSVLAGDDFWSRAPDTSSVARSVQQVDDWVRMVYSTIVAGGGPRRPRELVEGTLQPPDATILQPVDRVLWLQLASGNATLLADEALPLAAGTAIAVARPGWIQLAAGTEATVIGTERAFETGAARAGLQALGELALRALAASMVEMNERERERQRDRARAYRQQMTDAFGRLAASMTRHDAVAAAVADLAPAGSRTRDETLLAACRHVADGLGLAIPVALLSLRGREATLAEIARASRFQIRRVRLRDRWWREDGGPLLAFENGGREPVALVRAGRNGYRVVNPRTATTRTVDARVAATLAPHAYTFYAPFPVDAITPVALLKFALRGSSPDLRLMVTLAAATAALGLVMPIASGIVFNTSIPDAARPQLTHIGWLLVACAVVGALLQIARGVANVRFDVRSATILQAATWDRLLSLPVRFFRGFSAGDLAVRAGGLDALRQALAGAAARIVVSGALAAFNFVLLVRYNPRLALWAGALVALAAAVTLVVAIVQIKDEREASALRVRASGLVLQLLTGIAKIRVAGAEVHAFSNWARLFSRQRAAQFRIRVWNNYYLVFQSCFSAIALLVIVAAIQYAPTQTTFPVGDFVAFMAAFGVCVSGALAVGVAALSVLGKVPQYELSKALLTATPEVTEGKVDPGQLVGDVTIDHVTFRYSADGPPVLNDVTLHARAGEFIALVGTSGSGKSTILRLLLGFDAPETGSVYFDGLDLQGLDVHVVRRQIGVVLQDGRLTPGDIYAQIAGATSASLDDVWEVARMAGLDEDIRQMPMGMHTVIGEGASTVSGGQRQRLLIARAIVGRPRLLLLDEATSALDNRTQAIVSDSLARIRATRVIIAHRLSTIAAADRIYVLDRGRIVQEGKYAELVGVAGPFAELARRQIA